MKILLVTSQVTYMPNNYALLFEELFKSISKHICAVGIIKNLDLDIGKSLIGLRIAGAKNISKTLINNIISLPKDQRKKICQKYKVPVFLWRNMNDPEVASWVKKNQIDIILNLRTRCIYKNRILHTPKIGCFNLHHGILPKYRGTLCDLYALSEGRPAGFSLHKMTKTLDAGEIMATKEVSKGDKDYLAYLHKTVYAEAKAISNFIEGILENNSLPKGKRNMCVDPVMTRSPNKENIKSLLDQGMIL